MKFDEGRAELAPDLVNDLHSIHCNRFNSSAKKITHRVKFEKKVYSSKNKFKEQINECICMDRECEICSCKYKITA